MSMYQYNFKDSDCCGANRDDDELKENSIDRTIVNTTQKASWELVLDLQGNWSTWGEEDRR